MCHLSGNNICTVNDSSNKIIEKDCVVIGARFEKDKIAKPVWLPQQNFCFTEKAWESAYYPVFYLSIAEYIILHRIHTPLLDDQCSNHSLTLGFLPALYWCYKNTIQERNTNRIRLKKKSVLTWLARWLAQKYMVVFQNWKTNFDCKENTLAW